MYQTPLACEVREGAINSQNGKYIGYLEYRKRSSRVSRLRLVHRHEIKRVRVVEYRAGRESGAIIASCISLSSAKSESILALAEILIGR